VGRFHTGYIGAVAPEVKTFYGSTRRFVRTARSPSSEPEEYVDAAEAARHGRPA
jgi:preprotein translocase subunit Sss1